jgi:hypothetical protein
VIPTNPKSPRQILVRAALSDSVSFWNAMTDAQREAWNVYAAAIPYTDALGNTMYLTGNLMFKACWTAAKSLGVTPVTAAPTQLTRPGLDPTIVGTVTASTHTVSVAFDNAQAWAIATGGYLGVYMGRPVAPTVNFFKGPYTFLGKISGAATPPTSPTAFTSLPFTVSAGQRVFFKYRIITPDGRLSPEGNFRSTVV